MGAEIGELTTGPRRMGLRRSLPGYLKAKLSCDIYLKVFGTLSTGKNHLAQKHALSCPF